MKTLRILSAALLMILLAAPGAPAEEKLDLSLLDAQELSAAATW